MEQYEETIFEAVTKIVASTMEENGDIVGEDGGRRVAAYFRAVYDGLAGKEEAARPRGGFEVTPEGGGGWRFRVVGMDGETAGVSPVYPNLTACLDRLRALCE